MVEGKKNDFISRQAAIDAICKHGTELERRGITVLSVANYKQVLVDLLESLPSVQPELWTPVKMRPMDSEEREYWEDQFGYKLENEDAVMFDCQMPEDGQEILISFRKWISMDICEIDGGCYGLEGNGDWDGVIAWMPLPEPYKGEC